MRKEELMHVQEQGERHGHMPIPQSQEKNSNTGDGHACDPVSESLPLSILFSEVLIYCPLVWQ